MHEIEQDDYTFDSCFAVYFQTVCQNVLLASRPSWKFNETVLSFLFCEWHFSYGCLFLQPQIGNCQQEFTTFFGIYSLVCAAFIRKTRRKQLQSFHNAREIAIFLKKNNTTSSIHQKSIKSSVLLGTLQIWGKITTENLLLSPEVSAVCRRCCTIKRKWNFRKQLQCSAGDMERKSSYLQQ